MDFNSKIYVAGHEGLVGSAIWSKLHQLGYKNVIGKSITEMDLNDTEQVNAYFEKELPEYVILVAARVGGIQDCLQYPCDFLVQNLQIEMNVFSAAYKYGVKKLIFISSACIYPEHTEQPIKEEYMLTGALESANEPYGLAKIAGVKGCEMYNRQYGTNFIAVIPSNLYGPNGNRDLRKAHVVISMIRKFHLAKWLDEGNWGKLREDLSKYPISNDPVGETEEEIVTALEKIGITKGHIALWGTGNAKREFLWSEDLADVLIYVLKNVDFADLKQFAPCYQINVGIGDDIAIRDLAQLVSKEVGYHGEIHFDATKPEGVKRRLLDVERIHSLGWKHHISIEQGIHILCESY
jgi:GDP-L-fucose synthase